MTHNDSSDEEQALLELEELLQQRIEHFKACGASKRTVREIFEEVIAEAESHPDE